MTIRNIETILLGHSGDGGNGQVWSGGSLHGWTAAFVRIEAEGGIDGLGESYFGLFAPETIPPIVENLKPLLIGEDPFRIPYLIRKISHTTKFWNRHGLGKCVISAIDLALYDLAGKATRLPVYQLLGGLCHPGMATYASGGCSGSKEVLIAELRQARQEGFRAFKWRLVQPRLAGTLMEVLRDEAGPDFDLMVDFVQGSAPQPWPKTAVWEAAGAVAACRPAFLEEPFPVEDKPAHAELRRRVACPVAAGEGISSLEEAESFIATQAADILQPDVTICGGMGACRAIGALAEARHVDMAMHVSGATPSLMGNLHFALANANSVFVEYPRIPSPFRDALLARPLEITDGSIRPPAAPGLGVVLDAAARDRFRYTGGAGHSFRWEESPSPKVVRSESAMNLRISKFVLSTAVCLVAAAGLFAQDNTGTITGIVVDPRDAIIPGASVTATHVEQGTTRSAVANDRGIYEFKFLPIGKYEVAGSQAGFKKLVKKDLILTIGQTMRIDLKLEVGDLSQSVEVSSGASQALQLETSQVSQVIVNKQVADLPLNGRNFDDLIPLNAGVTNGGQRMSNTGYNMNGSRTDQNMFLIEGQSNSDFNNNLLIRPPLDSIEEFQIQTGTFSAEYGRTGGGVVSVQLKSGTNQFHGSVFEFLRNDKLDANNFFDNQVPLAPGETKAKRSPLKRNQFGGTFGGPVIKDKFFFFGDYQGSREVVGRSTIQSVPTALERQGDFSQTLAPGQGLFQNALLGTRYPGCDPANISTCQKIPAQFLDPVAMKLANLYPIPNQAGRFIPGQGTINNYSVSKSSRSNVDQFDIKLDNHLTTNDTLSTHYTYSHSDAFTPAAYGDLGPCVGCRVVLDLLAGAPRGTAQSVGINQTHTFSPSAVNQFRVGLTRSSSFIQTSDGGKNLADEIGLKNVNVSPLTTGLPWFLFSPSPSWIGTSPFTPTIGGYTDWQISDGFSLLRGRHRLKMGFEMHRRANNGSGNFFGKGAYIFSPLFTGNAFADFMSGRAAVIQQDLTPGTVGYRGQEYGWYLQDDVKVTSRLTLNLGVRYDVFPGFYEVNNRISNLDPGRGVVQLAGRNGAPEQFVNTDWNNIAPRFGFAYALTSKGDTVLRGGYGISYSNSNNMVNYAGLNPPFTRAFNQFNLSFTTFDAAYRISDGLPVDLVVGPDRYDVTKPAGSFRQIDPNIHLPYTQYFSFNIQRAMPGNVVAEIGYVGTKGTKLPGEVEGNPAPPGDPQTVERRRLYSGVMPNVGGVTYYINGFSSIYHSLQAKLEKRLSRGLQLLGTYTFSKSIDDKSGSAVTGGSDSNPSSKPMDPFNRRADRGLSSFDRRHRFVAAFNYDLPIGRGKAFGASWNRGVDALLGGWQVNGIVTFSSGLPFNVFASSSASCGCTANDMRPDRIKDGRLPDSERSVNGWFDKTAFQDPPRSTATVPGRVGNAGRNIIPGPGMSNIDFSLFKKFSFGEGKTLQFRAEYFNIMNHPNFLYPTSAANATWTSGGILTEAMPARIGQLALKFVF